MSRFETEIAPAYFSRPSPPFMTIPVFLEADACLMREPQNQAAGELLGAAQGRIDVVGDVHGCFQELAGLLARMGWSLEDQGPEGPITPIHPDPLRRLVLLGDLVSRGPDSLSCLRLSWGLTLSGRGFALLGNHDWQILAIVLDEAFAAPSNGRMDDGIAQLRASPAKSALLRHLHRTPDQAAFHHPRLGHVELVHAAPCEMGRLLGRTGPGFATYTRIYGCSVFEGGFVRNLDWRPHHPGDRWTIFGHQPFTSPVQLGRTIGLDLGQGIGGSLACLRLEEVDPAEPLAGVIATGPGLGPLL